MESILSQRGDSGHGVGQEAMRRLRVRSVCAIGPGLTDLEFDRIEHEFGFQFADDHRAFLATGLPVNTRPHVQEPGVTHAYSEPWPDWRHPDGDTLRGRLAWPAEGVLFDVQHNNFWHDNWGPRPADTATASAHAASMLAEAPPMIPVYGHRYLPAGRGTSGHAVLSMWQTDIVYYGVNLTDYIDHEFGRRGLREMSWEPEATVEFWKDFV